MTRHFASLSTALLLAACSPTVRVAGPASSPPPPQARGQSGSVHTLGIPPGHLPRAGQCRVWVPGMPPGRQARARACAGILATAPAGSWIVFRPSRDRTLVHVHEVHVVRAGIVVTVRLFNAESGVFVREDAADDHRDEVGGEAEDERGRGRRRP